MTPLEILGLKDRIKLCRVTVMPITQIRYAPGLKISPRTQTEMKEMPGVNKASLGKQTSKLCSAWKHNTGEDKKEPDKCLAL